MHGQVSDAGDVLYVLPQNFKAIISGRSWLLRLEPFFANAKKGAGYLVRVSFGTALVASIALVSLTIIAILTAASSSDRDDRRSGQSSWVALSNEHTHHLALNDALSRQPGSWVDGIFCHVGATTTATQGHPSQHSSI